MGFFRSFFRPSPKVWRSDPGPWLSSGMISQVGVYAAELGQINRLPWLGVWGGPSVRRQIRVKFLE